MAGEVNESFGLEPLVNQCLLPPHRPLSRRSLLLLATLAIAGGRVVAPLGGTVGLVGLLTGAALVLRLTGRTLAGVLLAVAEPHAEHGGIGVVALDPAPEDAQGLIELTVVGGLAQGAGDGLVRRGVDVLEHVHRLGLAHDRRAALGDALDHQVVALLGPGLGLTHELEHLARLLVAGVALEGGLQLGGLLRVLLGVALEPTPLDDIEAGMLGLADALETGLVGGEAVEPVEHLDQGRGVDLREARLGQLDDAALEAATDLLPHGVVEGVGDAVGQLDGVGGGLEGECGSHFWLLLSYRVCGFPQMGPQRPTLAAKVPPGHRATPSGLSNFLFL